MRDTLYTHGWESWMDTFFQDLRATRIFIDRFEGTGSGGTPSGTPKTTTQSLMSLPTQIGNKHLPTVWLWPFYSTLSQTTYQGIGQLHHIQPTADFIRSACQKMGYLHSLSPTNIEKHNTERSQDSITFNPVTLIQNKWSTTPIQTTSTDSVYQHNILLYQVT